MAMEFRQRVRNPELKWYVESRRKRHPAEVVPPSRLRTGEIESLQEAFCLSVRDSQVAQNLRGGRRLGDMDIPIRSLVRGFAGFLRRSGFHFLAAHRKSPTGRGLRFCYSTFLDRSNDLDLNWDTTYFCRQGHFGFLQEVDFKSVTLADPYTGDGCQRTEYVRGFSLRGSSFVYCVGFHSWSRGLRPAKYAMIFCRTQ